MEKSNSHPDKTESGESLTGAASDGGSPLKGPEEELVSVLVEGEGFDKMEAFYVPHNSTAAEFVAVVAIKIGCAKEGVLLFLEDDDKTLELSIKITKEHAHGKIHHVHRVKEIEVTVFYQGAHKTKKFPPSARVQRVLDWAVGPKGFKLDPTIAPEMELALHGQTDALPKSAHIGRYVRHPNDKLALDLIRGVVPNGGF